MTTVSQTTHTNQSLPSQAEQFFFDNNGYLVIEDFLTTDHIAALKTFSTDKPPINEFVGSGLKSGLRENS